MTAPGAGSLAHTTLVADRSAEAASFRAQHPSLDVGAAVIEAAEDGSTFVSWDLALEAGPTFHSSLRIAAVGSAAPSPTSGGRTQVLADLLAAVDSLSYWKAAASPRLLLPPNPDLDEVFAGRFDHLAKRSMAEFLYRNGLDESFAPEVVSRAGEGSPTPPLTPAPIEPGTPVGLLFSGGKDSIATALVLHDAGHPVVPLVYNPTDAMRRSVVEVFGDDTCIVLQRTLDPELLRLNAEGYLNGHTPFSGWLAMAGLLAADLYGLAWVAAGNGCSDDEDNLVVDGWAVNHQWTKTLQMEQWLDEVLRTAGVSEVYASPLRPLLELQVLSSMLRLDPDLLATTQSCNRSAALGLSEPWCNACPKCVWIALALEALDPASGRAAAFGLHPWDEPSAGELVRWLCGLRGPQPFECAATVAEVQACAAVVAERGKATARAVVAEAIAAAGEGFADTTLDDLLSSWGVTTQIPDHVADAARSFAGL